MSTIEEVGALKTGLKLTIVVRNVLFEVGKPTEVAPGM